MPSVAPGLIYRLFIDPLLSSNLRVVERFIGPNDTVLDIACGTGDDALRLGARGRKVTGIDLEEDMIATAERRRRKIGAASVRFMVADARNLPTYPAGSFGSALISMALHALPEEARVPVLREASRVARNVVIVDYPVPLPRNFPGALARFIEGIVGGEHLEGFRSFQSGGGVGPLLEASGVVVLKKISLHPRPFVVWKTTRKGGAEP